MKKLFLALVVMMVPFSVQAFSDLPESHPHEFALRYLQFEEVIGGYEDGTVRPDNEINRAELVKILVEGLGHETTSKDENCFPDVKEEWFAKYVCYAERKGWIEGYPNGFFEPSRPVNKVEALKIILNAFDVEAGKGGSFEDVPKGAWFAGFAKVAKEKNLLPETGGRLYPSHNRTRGAVAETMARIMMIKHMDDPAYNDQIEAEFKTYLLLHKLREENGVSGKLKLNPLLTRVARLHSQDMGDVIGTMSHGSSDGRQSYDRIKAYDEFKDLRTGENVGMGFGKKPYDAVKNVHLNIFMPEPDDVCNHRTTILSKCLPFTEVGIGVYVTKAGKTYFTADFVTSGYARAMAPTPHFEVPDEYEESSRYEVEKKDDDYVLTRVDGCVGDEVRLRYFVEAGVYERDGGDCGLFEFAYHPNGKNLFAYSDLDVRKAVVFYMTFSTVSYGEMGVDTKGGYASFSPGSGWKVTSHQYPYAFDFGQTVEVEVEKKDGSEKRRFELKFGPREGEMGVVKIREL